MSGVVSVWVPIGVAGVGFAGVLASQFLASWRDDRRWQRDRDRHEDDRRYTARQESYAQLIGAIERWDLALHPVRKARLAGMTVLDPVRTEWLRQSVDAATRALGLVVLISPEQTRTWITDVVVPRMTLTDRVLQGDPDHDELNRDWKICQDNYRTLRALMRSDLGLDAEAEFLRRASPQVDSDTS